MLSNSLYIFISKTIPFRFLLIVNLLLAGFVIFSSGIHQAPIQTEWVVLHKEGKAANNAGYKESVQVAGKSFHAQVESYLLLNALLYHNALVDVNFDNVRRCTNRIVTSAFFVHIRTNLQSGDNTPFRI